MQSPSGTPKSERLKAGSPLRVVLAVDPPSLLLRMVQEVKAMPGLHLAGAFSDAQAAIDWQVWDREGYHLAFVDLGLPQDGSRAVVQRLLSQRRAGTVVALGDHLWQEVRDRFAAVGVYQLLEKGDVVAFRSFLQERAR